MDSLESLTKEERAWVARDEKRSRKAYAIATRHPGMDPSGVYHVIRNLEKTPSERLEAALRHGNFSALTTGERRLLEALNRHRVRYMLVGLSAAVLRANTATRDIDVWFEDTSDEGIGKAVREAKGIWISGAFGMRPPAIGRDARVSTRNVGA